MTELTEVEQVNGVVEEDQTKRTHHRQETLLGVLRLLMAAIFYLDSASTAASVPLLPRIQTAFSEHTSLLPDAAHNTATDLLRWARTGSRLRALFLISVGTTGLLALTGTLLFALFFLAATVNAIIICFLISLALLAGFLAFFFACVTAIYVGALSIAMFVISTVTISLIIAVMVAAGWIGFFWAVWLAMKKIKALAKQSLGLSTSADSDFSAGCAKHQRGKGDLCD